MNLLKFLLPIFFLTSFPKVEPERISCAPEKSYPFRATITSVKDGLWSDPGTWGGGMPASSDAILIKNKVTVDVNATIAGAQITGALVFHPDKTVALQSSKNIIVTGLLQARPSSSKIDHLLRFINVKEDAFVGGGEDPIETDIGLWVMGAGKLDLQGSTKTGFTNAAGAINSGNSSITLRGPPENWSTGDEIMITPTAAKDYTGFDNLVLQGVSGSTLATSATRFTHPMVNNKWTAEVCNLTRNVRIEGTQGGKSHVFIRSISPQNIQYVQFRYLGPRKNEPGTSAEKEFILGRYGLHIHHCMDGSRGTLVEGCVMRDIDSHCYVPHGSHGVTVHNSISYNTTEDAFWWDEGPEHASHDTRWIHNIAALVKYVPRSINIENKDGDPTLSSRGFLLGHGDGNVCDSNVAVGTMGDEHDGAGYKWEAVENSHLEGVWQFVGNMAHNNVTGLTTWQNVQLLHVIKDFVGYNNGIGIYHGAYANVYKYQDVELYGNRLVIHAASSNQARARFENFTIDAGGQDYAVVIEGNTEVGAAPVLIRNLKATNYRVATVYDQSNRAPVTADIIQTDGKFVISAGAITGEVLRVQPNSGSAIKITKTATTTIPNFAPTIWGTGTGLLGEYFNNPDFTSPAMSRIDSYIGFSEWTGTQSQIHYSIKYSTYSVRWTGKIQPQFTETYTIKAISGNNGAKLFIDGKPIAGPIAMVAGKLYDIKVEYSKPNSIKSGIVLFWTSPSLEKWTPGGEYVPQSQLYPPDSKPEPPVNRPPIANAGQDVTITLPTNSTPLTGLGTDADGSVTVYKWSKIAGPVQYQITNPDIPAAIVSGLTEGVYTFRLTVTDNLGAVGFDDVQVTVKPAPVPPPNKPPVASVTSSLKILGTIFLSGNGSDPEGGVLTYLWIQTAGPAVTIIGSNTKDAKVEGAEKGTYRFKLKVTDDKGLSVETETGNITF